MASLSSLNRTTTSRGIIKKSALILTAIKSELSEAEKVSFFMADVEKFPRFLGFFFWQE